MISTAQEILVNERSMLARWAKRAPSAPKFVEAVSDALSMMYQDDLWPGDMAELGGLLASFWKENHK